MVVLIYLSAITLANLSSYYLGPVMSVVNAFLFIGLDLSCRDQLHEKWHENYLALRMFGLILGGSAITLLINHDASKIAIASMVAFAGAITTDFVVYSLMFKRHKLIKMNGSNVVSSIVDSIIFPTIAFGSVMPSIILGQIIAKIFGGAIWALIITWRQGKWMMTSRGSSQSKR